MIRSMPTGSPISLDTSILDLPNLGFRRLGPITARKFAAGIAGISSGKDTNNVTVDDLLHYLPMRYEDRSNLTRIRDLTDGMEASLELFVKLSGGRPIRSKRSFRTRLYIFKISATDRERSGKDVVIWTFLSGPHAPTIIENYTKKFLRGVRFIAFGKPEVAKSKVRFRIGRNVTLRQSELGFCQRQISAFERLPTRVVSVERPQRRVSLRPGNETCGQTKNSEVNG